MKKLSISLIVMSLLMGGCKDEAPKEVPSFEQLILGKWQSQTISFRKLVHNEVVLDFDSAETGVFYTFTDDYFLYINYDSILFDTVRYNFQGDSLYFIENARAFDTTYIRLLDEFNLHLLLESESTTLNGITISEETVGEFIRLNDPTPK